MKGDAREEDGTRNNTAYANSVVFHSVPFVLIYGFSDLLVYVCRV
jgi:hypothetical protein